MKKGIHPEKLPSGSIQRYV